MTPAFGKPLPSIAESCAQFPEALVEADPKAAATYFFEMDKKLTKSKNTVSKNARAALKKLASLPPNDSSFYTEMENAAHLLNGHFKVQGQSLLEGSLAAKLSALWSKFPSPRTRTAAKFARQDKCLENTNDAPFNGYMIGMRAVIKELSALSPHLAGLSKQIGTIPILPSGTAAPFGATFNGTKAGICVNPEESPPWIAILLMHELKHAENLALTKQNLKYSKAVKTKSSKENLIDMRIALDTERFLDELRSYAVSVHAARALIATAPEYYCRLWLPSFQAKRPIQFPSGYAAMEKRFQNGSIAEWVASLYTFKMKSYVPISLFVDGEEEAGLSSNVAKRAKELIATLGI